MRRRPFPRILFPALAICGSVANTACSVVMPPRPEDVALLLGEHKPRLMVTDPPHGIELDSEWRGRAGLNGCAPAEPSYLIHRTEGYTETGDAPAGCSDAFWWLRDARQFCWNASLERTRSRHRFCLCIQTGAMRRRQMAKTWQTRFHQLANTRPFWPRSPNRSTRP
jgi:hypothetical protein